MIKMHTEETLTLRAQVNRLKQACGDLQNIVDKGTYPSESTTEDLVMTDDSIWTNSDFITSARLEEERATASNIPHTPNLLSPPSLMNEQKPAASGLLLMVCVQVIDYKC
jgi:hypothetical protein